VILRGVLEVSVRFAGKEVAAMEIKVKQIPFMGVFEVKDQRSIAAEGHIDI
jgi:hypothetical protein